MATNDPAQATPSALTSSLIRTGADSIFAFLHRSAEHTPAGVCWQTLSDDLEPQYEGSLFAGVGGIPLFLADYARVTGETRALDLGIQAARWCSVHDRAFTGDGLTGQSLCFGRAGVGLAWLRLAEAAGDGSSDSECLQQAGAFGDRTLAGPLGPVTDFSGGVAGEGVFLLHLWEATHDERFLQGAVRRAQWLDQHAVWAASGCFWVWRLHDPQARALLGFAHGSSGIGYFFLLLHHVTGQTRWAALARAVAVALSTRTMADHGGLNWSYFFDRRPDDRVDMCQWCHGSPGIGLFYAKAGEVLSDGAMLEVAMAAGETTFAYGDVRANPSQCHGLAGNAELFIELFRLTGEARWLERAHQFAAQALTYRRRTPDGDVWQADDPASTSPDFMCGAAGVGHFFLRLLQPDRIRWALG